MPIQSLIRDENAVNVEIGYILNLVILIGITGSIAGFFFLQADASSQQAMRAGFTDLGSQIARDTTNMYITSGHSSNTDLNVKRDIPLTIGGKSYIIELKNATPGGMASINIGKEGFYGFSISTTLNSIGADVIVPENKNLVYSGSGQINITMIKNTTGTLLWIE